MICGKCGMDNKDGSIFCVQCGETLNKDMQSCKVCQSIYKVTEDYCPYCHTFVKPGYKLCKRCDTELEEEVVYCSSCKTKNKTLSTVVVKLALYNLIVLALVHIVIFTIALFPRDVELYTYHNNKKMTSTFNLSILDGDLYITSLVLLIIASILNVILIILLIKMATSFKKGCKQLNHVKRFSWLFPVLNFLTSWLYALSDGFISPWFEVEHPLFDMLYYGDSKFLYDISVYSAIFSVIIFFINLLIYLISLPKINRLVQRKQFSVSSDGEVTPFKEMHFFSYEKDNLALLIFLTIITFGIYNFIWVHKTTKNLKLMNNDRSGNAGIIVMFILLPLYNIYWYYKYSSKAYLMFHKKGVFVDHFVPVVTLLSCFIPILNFTILASKMNELYELEY
jgi:Domain of unknown function (DUF4234)/Double zinc ribbon